MRSFILASVSAFLIVGCGSNDTRPLTGLTTEKADQRAGAAMLLLKDCLVHKQEARQKIIGGVAAIAIPVLANFAVKYVGAAVDARKEGLSGQFIAGTTVDDINAAFNPDATNNETKTPCLVIYRGLFGATKEDATDSNRDSDLTKNHLTDLELVDYPAFYMEIRFQFDGNYLKALPKYIWYADTVARNPGSGKKHVGVVLAMTEQAMGRDSDPPSESEATKQAEEHDGDPPTADEALALFRFDLGTLEIGKSYLQEPGSPLLTSTIAAQPIRLDATTAKPASLLAYVVESEDPGLVLATFSEAFESQEDNLTSALTDFLRDVTGTD